jgi:MipA family protein
MIPVLYPFVHADRDARKQQKKNEFRLTFWVAIRYGLWTVAIIHAWSAVGLAAGLCVHIEQPPSTGNIVLMLFDSPNAFGDLRDPVKVVTYGLDGGTMFRIEGIDPGQYALLVYHDENENGQLDRNFAGIPRESLAFSNGYRPKGPPRFDRAAVILEDGDLSLLDVRLYRPLGKRGSLGVGLGAVVRGSPYRDYHGTVYQVIPSITYIGNRFQLYGPAFKLGLIGTGDVRLAMTGRYRIGVYDEDDSDFLDGMGDRKSTFMAGLALQIDLYKGINLSVGYAHDVLNRVGGGGARMSIGKSFQLGLWRLSTDVGLKWRDTDVSNYDFGIPDEKALPLRPAYHLDDTFCVESGCGLFIEITRNWLIILRVSAEFFDSEITRSPLVSETYVLSGFGAVSYVF